jgi:ribonuclease Z
MANPINITILGTSTGVPTAKRNHTAMLLEYNGENILIDCGEGTQRQMRKASLNPCSINKILITHFHGDHILGLPGLLQTLNLSEYSKKLVIYCPPNVKHKIQNLIQFFVRDNHLQIEIEEVLGKFFETKDFYLIAEELSHGVSCNGYSFILKEKTRLDRKKIKKLKLPNSPILGELQKGKDIIFNGKKIKAKDLSYTEEGKKISFVFDTEYTPNCIKLAKDSDLLIAESTYMEESEKGAKLAKDYLHLTAAQAGKIAKESKSKKLILTHISQRYDINPKKLLEEAKKKFKNTFIAEDLMKLKV